MLKIGNFQDEVLRPLQQNASCTKIFPKCQPVSWIGNMQGDVLFLYALPSNVDAANKQVDAESRIQDYVEEVAKSIPFFSSLRSRVAIGSLVLMKNSESSYRDNPNSTELDICMPHIKKYLTKQMTRVKLIIALDKYTFELCRRGMDVREMYLKAPDTKFVSLLDKPPATMNSSKQYGAIMEMHVGDSYYRVVHMPPMKLSTFNDFFIKTISHFLGPELTPPKPGLTFKSITANHDSPDIDTNPDLLTFQDFVDLLEEDMEKCYLHRLRTGRTTLSKMDIQLDGHFHTWCVPDARHDPYAYEKLRRSHFIYPRDILYNEHGNQLEIYGCTPCSTPITVAITNYTFTIQCTPHPALALGGTWAGAPTSQGWLGMQSPEFADGDLDNLRTAIHRAINFYLPRLQNPGAGVTLSFQKGCIYKAGYTADFTPTIIAISAKHFFLIEKTKEVINRLVRNYKFRAGPIKDRASWIRDHYFDFTWIQDLGPARIFMYNEALTFSTWHKTQDMKVYCGSSTFQRQLLGQLEWKGSATLERLEPMDILEVEEGYTSFDVPDHVRTAMDTEWAPKTGEQSVDVFVDPFICGSHVTYLHSDKRVPIGANHIPAGGYTYHSFILGGVRNRTENRKVDLDGREFIYCFRTERDLLQSFFHFRKILFAPYMIYHNGKNFDDPMLLKRARLQGIELHGMGYRNDMCVRNAQKKFESRALAQQIINALEGVPGLVHLDTLEIYRRSKSYASCELGYLVNLLLGLNKAEMPYQAIRPNWTGDDDSRRDLMDYCIYDAQLTLLLINRDSWMSFMTNFVRLAGLVGENRIFQAGIQEQVFGNIGLFNVSKRRGILFSTSDSLFNESLQTEEDLEDFSKEMMKKCEKKMVKRQAPPPKSQPLIDRFFGARSETPVEEIPEGSVRCEQCSTVFFKRSSNIVQRIECPSCRHLNLDSLKCLACKSPTTRREEGDRFIFTCGACGEIGSIQQLAPKSAYAASCSGPQLPSGDVCIKRDRVDVEADGPVPKRSRDRNKSTRRSTIADMFRSGKSWQEEKGAEAPMGEGGKTIGEFYTTTETLKTQGAKISDQERLRQITAEANQNVRNFNLQSSNSRRAPAYQGAIVMKTEPGWHPELPASCADFASMYPSEIRAYNQSGETLVYEDMIKVWNLSMDDLYEPCADHRFTNPKTGVKGRVFFVKPSVHVGLLAEVLTVLRADRKRAQALKAKYEKEGNHLAAAFWNFVQEVIKRCMNSIYGASGVGKGILSVVCIAATVTACGRMHIITTKDFLGNVYHAICIGGDTDSVFMQFPGVPCEAPEGKEYDLPGGRVRLKWRAENFQESYDLAMNHWLPEVNALFPKTGEVSLEFEKVMVNPLITALKRYSYKHDVGTGQLRTVVKGMESVRRDALPYVKKVVNHIFEVLMSVPHYGIDHMERLAVIERKKAEVVEFAREKARQLLRGEVSIEDLVLSKNLSAEFYTNEKQEHVETVRKMESRGFTPPSLGNRVPFVYICLPHDPKTGKEVKGYMKADDPEWVLNNNIPLDYLHYFKKKFLQPVTSVLSVFLKERYIDRARALMDTRPSLKFKQALVEIAKKDIFGSMGDSFRGAKVDTSGKGLIDSYLRGDVNAMIRVARTHKRELTAEDVENLQKKLREETRVRSVVVELLTDVQGKLEKDKIEYDVRMKQCRGCLRLPDGAPVSCQAKNCKHYFPRLVAQGALINDLKDCDDILGLVGDIEDLFI